MFSKKNYLKIIADKPEIFGKVPDFILDAKKIEEYRQIPNLAVGEISGLYNLESLTHALYLKRPDAFLPTVSYTGTEYGEWGAASQFFKNLKKAVEKDLKIYCADPVILGSPRFWWALNGRFAQELYARYGFSSQCYGCRLYAFVLRVPLCKLIDAHLFIPQDYENGVQGCAINSCSVVARYCSIFMASFGIDVRHDFVTTGRGQEVMDEGQQVPEKKIKCVLEGNSLRLDGSLYEAKHLDAYFESFALPVAGRIMSRVLSGAAFDYVQEVAAILAPTPKAKVYKRRPLSSG